MTFVEQLVARLAPEVRFRIAVLQMGGGRQEPVVPGVPAPFRGREEWRTWYRQDEMDEAMELAMSEIG